MGKKKDKSLPDHVRIITLRDPDEYPTEQLSTAFFLAALLGRGDFIYVEEPET